MKRHTDLIPFSHDHQHGLAQALRLRRAAESGDERALTLAVTAALAFVDGELSAHFHDEEVELLPAMRELGVATDAQVTRMALDHVELRRLARRLRDGAATRKDAAAFAQLLHDHIRWEERELFAAWQQHMS